MTTRRFSMSWWSRPALSVAGVIIAGALSACAPAVEPTSSTGVPPNLAAVSTVASTPGADAAAPPNSGRAEESASVLVSPSPERPIGQSSLPDPNPSPALTSSQVASISPQPRRVPVSEPPAPPRRTPAPYDVDPLEATEPPATLRNLRDDLADQCDGLPAVPGVTTCLTLVVTPKGASDDCVVNSVDQTDAQNGKLERGAKIPVEVDCSADETTESTVETTDAAAETSEANSDE